MRRSLPENPQELAYVHLYSEVLQDDMYLVNRRLSLSRRHIIGYQRIAPLWRPLLLGLPAI